MTVVVSAAALNLRASHESRERELICTGTCLIFTADPQLRRNPRGSRPTHVQGRKTRRFFESSVWVHAVATSLNGTVSVLISNAPAVTASAILEISLRKS